MKNTKFTHIKTAERREIAFLLGKGYSLRDIANMLKRSPNTISKEVGVNAVKGIYDPEKANHKAYVRRKYSKYQGMKVVASLEARNYIEEKLKAALFNIIDNAVKYTNRGSVVVKIKKETSSASGRQISKIKIIVEDTGIGIPKEKLPGLFEAQFERSEAAKRIALVGSGVGLYLAGQIIKAHNGRVWAESPARRSPGEGGEGEEKGSAFFVELPIG